MENDLTLPPLNDYSIPTLDKQADDIIELFKTELKDRPQGLKYFNYHNHLFYRCEADVWVSKNFWIDSAKQHLLPFCYETTTAALEILMTLCPDEYRQQTWAYLDHCVQTGWAWCEEGAKDIVNLAEFVPDHPVNQYESDSNYCWMTYFNNVFSQVERKASEPISLFASLANNVHNELARQSLTDSQCLYARNLATNLAKHSAKQVVVPRTEVLLRVAAEMKWSEVTDAVLKNPYYLGELAGVLQDQRRFLLASPFAIHVLAFSRLRLDDLAGQFAAKGLESCSNPNCSLEDRLASAIAWKRFRSHGPRTRAE